MLPPWKHGRTVRLGRARQQDRALALRAGRGRYGWLAAALSATLVLFGAPVAASADELPAGSPAAPIVSTSPEAEPPSDPEPQPAVGPTPAPTAEPAPDPTSEPTPEPTVTPTPEPTLEPTATPTPEPTLEPTPEPTPKPTAEPTPGPSAETTPTPTPAPTLTEDPAPEPNDGPIPPVTAVEPAPNVDPLPHSAPDAVAQAAAAAASAQTAAAARAAAEALAARRAAAERVAAARTAAQELTAQRGAALTSALTRSQTAQAVLDTAREDLESARASQTIALGRASLVHRLAVEASRQAAESALSLAVLARRMAQQQSGAGVTDVFFGGHSLGNVLDQLSTLDQLDRVTDNIDTIQARAEADEARAITLNQQDTETRIAASMVSVDASQARLDAAERDFEAAGLALVAAASAAQAAATSLASLDLRPINRTDVGQLSEQGWTNPARGAITDAYGPRPIRPLPGVGAYHYGTDIGTSCGTPVFAATAGIVQAAGSVGSYGNWILLDHGEGVQTGYAHLGDTLVAVGDRVGAGQQIGRVGSTGLSTGCHTHVEVRVDGVRIDPQPFFRNRGVALGR